MTQSSSSQPADRDPGLLKVVTGTAISGGMAYLFLRLLQSILHNLPPIALDGSTLARSLSIGVRYMLVGAIGLLTFMFAVVTVGLLAYSGRLGWQGLVGEKQDAGDRSDESTTITDTRDEAIGDEATRDEATTAENTPGNGADSLAGRENADPP